MENNDALVPQTELAYSTQQPELRTQGDPNNPPWGLARAILVLFLSILLVVIVPNVVALVYAFSKGFSLASPDQARALAEFAITDPTTVILQIVAMFPVHLVTLLMVWAVVTNFGKRPFWAALGWDWGGVNPVLGWITSIAIAVAMFVVANVVAKLLGGDKTTPLEQIIHSSWAARYLISLLAVATAPLVEELVYRGLFYAALLRVFGVKVAVAVVIAVFTLIHIPQYRTNPGVVAGVALLSVTLTLIRARTGRLLPCVIIHLIFNGITALILVLEPQFQRVLPTPDPIPAPATIMLRLIGLT